MVDENRLEIQDAQPSDVAVLAGDPGEIFQRIVIERPERPSFESVGRAWRKFLVGRAPHFMMLCRHSNRVNAAHAEFLAFSRAQRPDSKAATTEIDGHLRKSSGRQSRERRRRRHRHKRAPGVPHSVQPPVQNLKGKEYSTWPKHPPNFRKSAILQLVRRQMMKHENRNRRRKCAVRKRQRRSVPLDHCHTRGRRAGTELGRKRVVVLETSHACRPRPQLLRRRTQPRTQLQHVLAKLRAFENPRQKLPPRYIPPERRSAKPCFESIHR